VTGVTSLAVVRIPADIIVFIIHFIFIVFMTIDTGEYLVVCSQMTLRTCDPLVVSRIDGELMIKYSLVPGNVLREMTVLAGGGKSSSLMIRVFGVLVILLVATIAIGGQIIPGRMAFGAIQSGVRSPERPVLVMIKDCSFPGDSTGSMTGRAVGRKSGGLVIWIGSTIVVV
jgi:hypothetical protein